MNLPKDGRTGLPFFAGINIRQYMMGILGNLKSGPKNPNFSGKQSIKKYPDINVDGKNTMMLIPTRYVGVNFCIKGVS